MIQLKLGELCELRYGKALAAYEPTQCDGYKVRVFGTNGPIGWSKVALFDGASIIVGRKGAYRGIHFSPGPAWAIDTAYFLKLTGDDVDIKWLYYKLLTYDINRLDSGSAIPSTKREDFYSLEIALPPITTQTRIADILGTFDDLIENNRRRIRLLEESARLLYREWFVYLRFPGHERVRIVDSAPEGWQRRTLGDIATLHYGKALKAENRVPGPYPVFGSSGIVGTNESALASGPGIIIGRKGNVGSVFWSPGNFYAIDTVYFIDSDTSNLFLYYALRDTPFISTDVAVPGLNRNYAYSRSLQLPPSSLVDKFLDVVDPIHHQIETLTTQNKRLTAARDLLLPRLMSGDLAV